MHNEYKLTETDQETILTVLHRGKYVPTICPHNTPLLIKDQYGAQMVPRVCGSMCPMFDKHDNSGVFLHCSNRQIIIENVPAPWNSTIITNIG